jgi:hypothetical protein
MYGRNLKIPRKVQNNPEFDMLFGFSTSAINHMV